MTFPKLWSRLSPLALALAALTFGFDQTIKWYLLNVVQMEERRQITITPFFDLVMAWNRGVSYGLFSTDTQAFLIIVSILISILLWMWGCRAHRPIIVAAIGLIIGGALANALDRAVHGAVADFFLLHWGAWNWYIFNPADMAIVAGVGVLFYESLMDKRPN
jgi:signal peptidase II